MPENKPIAIKNLKLDLKNYRTVPQVSEASAIEAMILISPERFWGLMDSILDSGYLPTENVIVLKTEDGMVVREGNRRVAVLKLIYGDIATPDITIPDALKARIAGLSTEWKADNLQVPSAIYLPEDKVLVDKIVTLTHGKGEKAGRDQWGAVARARHNRDVNGVSEPALDLLEKYLKQGKNVTFQQAERWAGDYPLSVLEEAIKKIAPRTGSDNAPDLASKYPAISSREALDAILNDIGLGNLRFVHIRAKEVDFADTYGVPKAAPIPSPVPTPRPAPSPAPSPVPSPTTAILPSGKKIIAVAINDPVAVLRALKGLTIVGNNRSKVVTLRDEAVLLKLAKNPIAFCFLLRSMFEISAKAYCDDYIGVHGAPVYKKPDGQDRNLVDVLRDVTAHLTSNNTDKTVLKVLHGSITELAKPAGILSVTSMNALVHNPNFSLTAADISTTFGNVFTLLKAMNE